MRKRLGLAASLKREVASLNGASQLDGKARVVLPAQPAIPVTPEGMEVPTAKEPPERPNAPVAMEIPILTNAPVVMEMSVNGANGTHEAMPDEELSEPRKAHAGVELPALHMAPVAPLEREACIIEAAEKGDRISWKWLKRQKELANMSAKFE